MTGLMTNVESKKIGKFRTKKVEYSERPNLAITQCVLGITVLETLMSHGTLFRHRGCYRGSEEATYIKLDHLHRDRIYSKRWIVSILQLQHGLFSLFANRSVIPF